VTLEGQFVFKVSRQNSDNILTVRLPLRLVPCSCGIPAAARAARRSGWTAAATFGKLRQAEREWPHDSNAREDPPLGDTGWSFLQSIADELELFLYRAILLSQAQHERKTPHHKV